MTKGLDKFKRKPHSCHLRATTVVWRCSTTIKDVWDKGAFVSDPESEAQFLCSLIVIRPPCLLFGDRLWRSRSSWLSSRTPQQPPDRHLHWSKLDRQALKPLKEMFCSVCFVCFAEDILAGVQRKLHGYFLAVVRWDVSVWKSPKCPNFF